MKYDRIEDRRKHCDELREALFPALRYCARCCGYALAVHGSLSRDIDLIAVPWRDHCVTRQSLIEHFFGIAKAVVGEKACSISSGTAKPLGRLAVSIYLTPDAGEGPYLDLSVCARNAQEMPEDSK